MTYPNRGLLKAAMGHYLTESARTALEAMEPDEDVVDVGPGKQMPAVGPNQILDMPLFTKIPFLPGSNTMFYRTNLGEKLYQPSATFDLNDPYCKLMAPSYKSLHDPHLRAYYKRKDNLRRLKKAGHITDKNKVVCTLKEFNEYRQYLTSLKLEFEKHYIREQKMLEKQITKLQDTQHLPEAADTSKYRDWMLKEERPTIQEQETVMRNRYLELINQELEKLEQLAEENRQLALAQDDKKKQGLEKRKQLLLRKKMEEEWRKKEMLLLMKIGDDVKREARIEEQRRKSKEDKLKRKQNMLEKKMAHHLRKLQERFQREGLLPPPDKMVHTIDTGDRGHPTKKQDSSLPKTSTEEASKTTAMERKSTSLMDKKGPELQKVTGGSTSATRLGSQLPIAKGKNGTKQSMTTLLSLPNAEEAASKSATFLEQDGAVSERDLLKESLELEPVGEGIPVPGGGSSKVSFSSAKDLASLTSNTNPPTEIASSVAESMNEKITPSASGGVISNEGGVRLWKQGVLRIRRLWKQGVLLRIGRLRKQGVLRIRRLRKQGVVLRIRRLRKQGVLLRIGRLRKQGVLLRIGRLRKQGVLLRIGRLRKQGVLLRIGRHSGKVTGGYDSSGGSSSKHGGSGGSGKVPADGASNRSSSKPSNKANISSATPHHTVNEGSGKGKQKKRATLMISAPELNSIIQNIMTWVVSAVTSILYPALTKFEERVRTRVYTISEESVLSSDNSSSCSSCNEDFYETYRTLPTMSTRKVSFTDTSIKPATPSDLRSISGKPASLFSSKSSYTSFTKSTQVSLDTDLIKGKLKRGKTAIFLSPTKHCGLLSTTASMRSSKSDSQITQLQKGPADSPEKPGALYHGKRKCIMSRGPFGKADTTTTTTTTDTEGLSFVEGEQKPPPHGPIDQREGICLKDLKSIFAELKLPLSKITAIILDDVFKMILVDQGCSASISVEDLLESISESLLGSPPSGQPVAGSVSRIASFVAADIVESVLSKLHSTTQKKYFETISKDGFMAECKVMCVMASGKHSAPDPSFWRSRMPLSLESTYEIAEEIVQIIIEKLKVFATSSQTKVSQFELCAKIKAIGIPLGQLCASVPPHTVESEAANALVKDTIRKIVSKTVTSSETNLLQYVEEMIASILNFIQRQMCPEGTLPTRESSIVLQLINDVFNSLSTEKLQGIYPAAKPRSCLRVQGELPSRGASPDPKGVTLPGATHMSGEKSPRKPFPPVNVPGMVIYSEMEAEEKEKRERDGTLSSVNKERQVLLTEEVPDKVRYESFGLESRHWNRLSPKSAEADKEGRTDAKGVEKDMEHFVQDAIFSSLGGQQKGQCATAGEWSLEQALQKMEEDFKEEEQSPIIRTVWNLLNEMFQHIWAEQPVWPPGPPPPSLAHMDISRCPPEEQPSSKGHTAQLRAQAVIPDADVSSFACDLVKTAFEKISRATQTEAEGIRSRHSSLIITDILPLNVPGDTSKSPPTVHFREPETACQSRPAQEETQNSHTSTSDDSAKASQPEHRLLSKSDLAKDLVQTFISKLETFVTCKVESQLCSDVQNLKTCVSSDFSSAIQQELRRMLANQCGGLPSCLEDILNSSVLGGKEKALRSPYANLKPYAQEVAKMMLKSLKHGLDREVEKISIPPVIFSESIAASQIVSLVLMVFAPAEAQCSLPRQDSILEKLFRKNPDYKRDIQAQIQNTVEMFLNEIYQTVMLDVGSASPSPSATEKLHTLGTSKAGTLSAKKVPSAPLVGKPDVSLVSNDIVDIVLEDLSSGLATVLNTRGALSDRLQCFLYDLIQRTVEPLTQLAGREGKGGLRSHFLDLRADRHKAPGLTKGRKAAEFGSKQLSELKDCSLERMAKYLVDNISHRLELFAEEKLESELATDGQSRAGEGKAVSHRNKAKIVVQDSLSNLRLCAEKLTSTILKVIQADLEREMLSCQNIIPYEENASANELMNDLLKILSVQIALTENEVQKRVLKRIFRQQPSGQKGGFPLVTGVEDVLNQVTQKVVGELGHLPSFRSDSLCFGSESKSSAYNGMIDAISQANAGSVAGDIVDSVFTKIYSIVMEMLFGSRDGDNSGRNKNTSVEASSPTGKSEIQKMTLALSQLHPTPQTIGEELVQNVLNKIASFAASNLEEVLPQSMQQKRKRHSGFQHEMHGGDGMAGRPQAFSDDSETSLMRASLCKSDLTVYAKDVVGKVLGTIIDDFKTEDYHRTILRVNTLSSEQISLASDLVHSIVQDLHIDGPHSHVHQHTTAKSYRMDNGQMYLQIESTTKDIRGKPKCLFYEDFLTYLKQVLPKEGILKDIFEQQPLTDANINETLKMLQVAESIVSEVLMRTRDLESSVCILKKTQGELSERLFCCSFKRSEAPGLFHSDSQAEIGSVARDIVASVFENVHKCLMSSIPATSDGFPGRKVPPKGRKNRFTQPDFPFYNVSLKGAMDTIDKIAKETVECTVLMLETFVARHFRRDFRCNFLEIVKFPLESLAFAQLTRSLDSLSAQVRNVAETTVEGFRNKLQGGKEKGGLPTLGSTHNFLDFSKLGGAVTKECFETAIRQVQMLHAELNVYANNAVSSILEIIKHTLDRELSHKEATLFCSSSESLVLSETISVMLDRCNESLTEITSELMVENLQLEMSGRGLAKDKTLFQDHCASPGNVKTTSKKIRRIDMRDSFPPINVPGMVIYSEEEAEMQEETPSKFPSVFRYSEWDAHVGPERHQCLPGCLSAPRVRPSGRRRQDRVSNRFRLDFPEDDWLPRQSSIPEGTILEKLFKKTGDCEAVPRLTKTGHRSKVGNMHQHEPFARGPAPISPESGCCSAICPLKLGHAAEEIVNTLLCEFAVEGESMCYEKNTHLFPLREGPKPGEHGLLSRWDKRQSDSSERATTEESCFFMQEGSNLLSKWESNQYIFKSKSPDRHKDLELLACFHVPDLCEIQTLANHIVLSVIKELIAFRPKDALDEKGYRTSCPAWKQEMIQSESRWLQERIWRSTYLPHCKRQSSCLDVFWEPLTQAVVSNVIRSILNPCARQGARERNDGIETSLSMFCSVDSCCPEHGIRGPKSAPVNIKELAFHISERILGILCERNILQETVSRKGFLTRKSRYICLPPLCLADFDEVYHPLVKEVAHLLCLEIEIRCKSMSERKAQDALPQQQPYFSRCACGGSRGDCRGPCDIRGGACLSAMDQIAHKNQRLSCVASNLDSFIRSLKSTEAKQVVNKVLHIILDSMWPGQPQGSFAGHFPDAQAQNMSPYHDTDLMPKRKNPYSSVCPHAYRLGNEIFSGNLGLSPKSVVLLDVVSEKLIRTLLDKCITTDHFTGTFAFDEFPEDEQFCDIRKSASDGELFQYSSREMKAHKTDSASTILTYDIQYSEEPWVEPQAGVSSYESALDMLAHTLVKPVITELSYCIDHPGHGKPYSKKAVGFSQGPCKKGRGQSFGKKHPRGGKSDMYHSLPRGKRPEWKAPVSGRHQARKNLRDRNKTVLETAMHHRTCTSQAPSNKHARRKPHSATCNVRTYRREVVTMTGRGDHRQFHPDFTTIYSASFLEEVICQLLFKIFSSLHSKYNKDTCIDLQEMNTLFVSALVEEFTKAGVGVLMRAEEKAYFQRVDSRTVCKIVDSILREFGFQLAADRDIGRDIESLAEKASEIILTEILDYQLPPVVCRRLPRNAFRNIKAEQIIQKIECCICLPKFQKRQQPTPAYITVLSQKYLERVVNQLVNQLFPPCKGAVRKPGKREVSGTDFDELCSYMIKQVMASIAKHKIWVAKKDAPCRSHSEMEIQTMVNSVYRYMLEKSGSQESIQKDIKRRDTDFIDCITSFIIQEITNHHLQRFLSKEESSSGCPDPEALSEDIVRTVLDSLGEPLGPCGGVFPARFLEEIVSRVLANVLPVSRDKKESSKGWNEAELERIAKQLACSINLHFGKSAVTGVPKGDEPSLMEPLMDIVVENVVDSVCNSLMKERDVASPDDLSSGRQSALFDKIKRLVEKGISDYLLHPLFSGDLPKATPSTPSHEYVSETQEETESRSPFSTFLSSGFLKDLITGLLSKIFPSTSMDKRHLSESDFSKLSTQLLNDVQMKLLKHQIKVTKDMHPEQCEYSDEDVQNMTDSLCSKIIQKSGSLEAVQRDVKNKSKSLIDRIAGFLVGDILQKHVQPFVARQESPTWDRAAAGDSMSRFEVYKTTVKPLDLRQASLAEKRGPSSPSSFLGEVISQLISRISSSFSDTPLSGPGDFIGDTAVKLVKSLTKELTKAQLHTQEGPEEPPLGSLTEDRTYKDSTQDLEPEEDTDKERHVLSRQTATMIFEGAINRMLGSAPGPPPVEEAKCLIHEILVVDQGVPVDSASPPYSTALCYPVLEAIVDRLLLQIFPSPSSSTACLGQGEGGFGSEMSSTIAQLKKDILDIVLKQAIWISTYGNRGEACISEEAIACMVDSVYCDVLHEVMLQQPLPEDKESLRNLYVTQIACFIINEMFKYHLQSTTFDEAPSYVDPSAGDSLSSCMTVFPFSLLEDMLNQLLERIFPTPESINACIGNQVDFSETDFSEMVANLKRYVIAEILAHQILLGNTSGQTPEMDEETKEDIACSVYNQILQKSDSLSELQSTLKVQGNSTLREIANLLIREILNFHLHPFLDSSDSATRECAKLQKEKQPVSQRIYSAAFLEDAVVAFFCKILSSPNFLAYSKDCCLSESEMRDLVTRLVNALVFEFKISEVKVFHGAEGDLPLPKIAPEEVIQISNCIYEKLLQQLGSECEIFKAFQNEGHLLAEKLAPLIIREICAYQLMPLFTGDTSLYLFSFLEAETILDRVETILPDTTPSGSMFGEMFLKIMHKMFPSWVPGSSPDSPLGSVGKRSPPRKKARRKPSPEAGKSIQSLMDNICKAVCVKPGSLNQKYETTEEESAEFLCQSGQDYPLPKSHSPPGKSPLPTYSTQTDRWTIHYVKPHSPPSQLLSPPPTTSSKPECWTIYEDKLPSPPCGSHPPPAFPAEADDWTLQRKKPYSPPSQLPPVPAPSFSAKTSDWTIHHVKLGEGEVQAMQFEDGGGAYSSTFLKDIFSGLVSKLLSSTTSVCPVEKKEAVPAEEESSVRNLVESILKEFAKSPVKVLQLPIKGQGFPSVGKTDVAKIIHGSLCGILQDRAPGAPIWEGKESDQMFVERLASAIKKEILGYQIQGLPRTPQSQASKPFEMGEMAKKVLMEVKKNSTPSPVSSDRPNPLLVSQRFIHEVLAILLSKILPFPTTSSDNAEEQCAEFDFIHMKLLSNVMSEISKDKNAEVQYLDRVQPNRVVSQTVANTVYHQILPEFGTAPAIEKCIRTGCTILMERITDLVMKEIYGNPLQAYFSEELGRQQEAIEAERKLEEQYGGGPAGAEGETPLRSHLKGLSSIILEEVAAKFLSKLFCALPVDDLDTRSVALMKEVGRKMINSLQSLISKKNMRVWQHDELEDLGSEDSRAVGEVVDSVYTDMLRHSSSEASMYDDLTNKKEDFVNRVACFMVSEISGRDFQSTMNMEDELPRSSAEIKLETDKIIEKFLGNIGAMEPTEVPLVTQVPVAFLEEILSRLLTKILLAQKELGFQEKKALSKTDVNEIACQLKTSVEKKMSKNKMELVADSNQPELHPQYEEKVDHVVHTVLSNVMEKSGSQQELYNDMRTNKVIFPEQVASIIINEVSSCSIGGNPFDENTENETVSALELDRIVSKVYARVSSIEEEDEDPSDLDLTNLSAVPEDPETLLQKSDMPVKIIPCIGHRALKVDPEIVAEHLAVLSIKTEPLEKLKKTCMSKIGMSLTELRRASMSGKSLSSNVGIHDPNKKKERRPSLDMAGRLGVRPKEAVCRNSFQSLMRPDITRVELLKDVESKQDLILRLVAHDIEDNQPGRAPHFVDLESDGEETVLKEHRSFYFEVPPVPKRRESSHSTRIPSDPLLAKTPSSTSRKKSLSLSKCCPPLTLSSSSGEAKEKKEAPPIPQIEVTAQSTTSQVQMDAQTTNMSSTPITETEESSPVTFSSSTPRTTSVEPSSTSDSDREKILDKAAVEMHLTRDTEAVSGPFEIMSVYQDVPEYVAEYELEQEEATTEQQPPLQQKSSVFEKVSSALSRVFSRTSGSSLTQPSTSQEKVPGDQA
ncbi:fibrous sheath-interacting protein 2 [Lacerta agilis]|uniref:fibrous sheath-interacting protein 2 n=1 Tax=Lacerta agilis TaxID=80427 RepID=UPI00141A5DE3|nr:fibrous sheath-interacting protein 2 [Lacerta agilis]